MKGLSEIDRCSVLCRNCHRTEHHVEPTEVLRAWLHERTAERGGCAACTEPKVACLDFHHTTGEKTDTIARIVTDGRPKDVIRSERARCEALRANRHLKKHFEPPEPLEER